MIKFLLKVIIFIFFSINLFSKGILRNITFSRGGQQLVINITSVKKPSVYDSYDEFNKLLFIEAKDISFNNYNKPSISNRYMEKIEIMDYGKNTGFFIKLKKGSTHKIKVTGSSPRYKITIDFKSTTIPQKEFTIAIDAGHGGKDPGAIGFRRFKEKDIALAVAKKLKIILEKDFNVIMIRDSDSFVSLSDRSKIANEKKADFFVSLHLNSSPSKNAKGMEVFYFSKKSSPYAEKIAAYENSFGEKYGEQTSNIAQIMGELAYIKNMENSLSLARPLNKNFSSNLKMHKRGVFGANFAVLRGFNGPGVLVELGFISNKEDIKKLSNSRYQNLMANSIAESIKNYFY